jgi:tetratricopeptide (TPR) repeat protein
MSDVISILRLGTRRGFRRAKTPMTAVGWFEQGVAHEAAGELAAARTAYERAHAAAPDLADAACNLGRLLHESGDVAGAEASYRLAVCADRAVAVYWFNLGVAVEDRGRAAEAIACYREALARDPQLADAHFNVARLYERAGDLASARAAIRHFRVYRSLRRTA